MRISDWSSDVCSSDLKRNSFTDFIACAEYLADEGYTAKGKIVAYGLSAGGLLVGASMNIAPTLWGGVIAKVPFVDMLDRKSVVSGQSVSVRLDLGGRRIIYNKKSTDIRKKCKI